MEVRGISELSNSKLENKHTISVRIEKDILDQFKAISEQLGTSYSEILRTLIDEYINENDK